MKVPTSDELDRLERYFAILRAAGVTMVDGQGGFSLGPVPKDDEAPPRDLTEEPAGPSLTDGLRTAESLLKLGRGK